MGTSKHWKDKLLLGTVTNKRTTLGKMTLGIMTLNNVMFGINVTEQVALNK